MVGTQVRQILLERILSGGYEPGERLIETRIARELRVSQGSVREALRGLEGLGFVEAMPYRGTRVRGPLTEAELAEVHPVRAVLEGLAAELAVPALSQDTSELHRELAAMRRAAADNDRPGYALHNARFHRVIVAAANNRALQTAWESLAVEARLLVTVVTTAIDLSEAAERHVQVIDAIEASDTRRVRRLLEEHQALYQGLPHDQQPERATT